MFEFKQHGKCGAWVSELLPNLGSIVDDLTIIKTLNTEAINHDPAITYIQTGHQQPGRPSLGAWRHLESGSAADSLPAARRRGGPAARRTAARACRHETGCPPTNQPFTSRGRPRQTSSRKGIIMTKDQPSPHYELRNIKFSPSLSE
jgi:hypothetical protein